MFEEAAHEIEEAHQHTGLTAAVSVERHVGDEARRKPDFGEPVVSTTAEGEGACGASPSAVPGAYGHNALRRRG